jgi:hypothetical protein
LLGVIAAVCVVLFLNVAKKPKPAATLPSKAVTDPLAGVVDNPPPTTPEAAPTRPTVAPTPEAAPDARGHGKGRPLARGRGAASTGATAPPPIPATTPPPPPVVDNSANSRYRDGHNLNITGGGINRPAPSQADISRVINSNRGGIKNCYQRALLRDNSLTHGKISVKVTIGISGRVKHTSIDGPPQFRSLDPCIKEVVGRWAFPQASDEYGTEFVYVFQGNE